jgi:hypothetical protein
LRENINDINLYFDNLKARSEADYKKTLHSLHGSIEKLMCYLIHSKVEGKLTLEQYAGKIKGHIEPNLKEKDIFAKLKVS